MLIKIITKTEVNWLDYFKIIKEIVGESPTAEIDAKGLIFDKNLKNYLATLKSIFNEDSQSTHPYSDPMELMNHVSVSFIYVDTKSTVFKAISKCHLTNVSIVNTIKEDWLLVLMTGTLTQWASAVVAMSIINPDFSNEIISQLDIQQFRNLFQKVPNTQQLEFK